MEFSLGPLTLTLLIRLASAPIWMASWTLDKALISASNSGQGSKRFSGMVYKNRIKI